MKNIKTFLCILITFSYCYSLKAQYDTAPNTQYTLTIETAVYPCNILGEISADSFMIAPAGATFVIINSTDDSIVARFWKYPKKMVLKDTVFYTADSIGTYLYYLISNTELANKARLRFSTNPSFTMGIMAIPLKLRMKPFELSKDFMLGTSFGMKWRLSPYSENSFLNILGTFGLSHVTLDSLSTGGEVQSIPLHQPAFSLGTGAVIDINQTQFGIFMGWDFISQNDRYNWAYQGKPWLSIGLGITLFKQDGNTIQSPISQQEAGKIKSWSNNH